MRKITKLFGILITSFILLACGGGGSSSDNGNGQSNTPVETGSPTETEVPTEIEPPIEMETVFRLVEQSQPSNAFANLGPLKVTFEYNEKGDLIRLNESSNTSFEPDSYVLFEYDDEDRLLISREFNVADDKLIRFTEYDLQGEIIFRSRGNAEGTAPLEPLDVVFVNEYFDESPIDRSQSQLKLFRRHQTHTAFSTIYPFSKLSARERSGTAVHSAEILIDGNVVTRTAILPNGTLSIQAITTFNEFFDVVRLDQRRDFEDDLSPRYHFDYSYERDANGNIIKRIATDLGDGDGEVTTTTYVWEEMEVPVR